MEKPETITDLMNDLIELKNKLKEGSISLEEAKEFNNTAGKLLSAVKILLASQALALQSIAMGEAVSKVPYLGNALKCSTEQKTLPAKSSVD